MDCPGATLYTRGLVAESKRPAGPRPPPPPPPRPSPPRPAPPPANLAAGTARSTPPDTVPEPNLAKLEVVDPKTPEPPSLSLASRKPAGPAHEPIKIEENAQVDRFGLIREIARGGMGQVFLARDMKLGRKVAIKFLLHDDRAFAQRFLVEARATARCTHENIISIYEVGEYQGLPYMVLEYLEGKTLAEVLLTKPGPRQFAELMLSVLRALERAHEHNIVHRDLKPSNIFVTDRGHVKVLDFGIARVFNDAAADAVELTAQGNTQSFTAEHESASHATLSGGGAVIGTLLYMSPEQWGAAPVDHQSDLWACGVLFWRALVKIHPAGTTKADKLKQRLLDLDTPFASIGTRDESLPPELVAIVDRLLCKYKKERFQTATEVIAALEAFLAPHELATEECPYRGLAAFGEGDAKFFFGRSSEIRTALAQLESWPLLAVIGPSGAGKSSFVHAGLIPAIRASAESWQVRVLRPGRAPLQSLAATLDDLIDESDAGLSIVEQLREAPGRYAELLRNGATRTKHRVLIVVDQLEELFTLSGDDEVRALFLAALLAAADDPSAPVRVVLSMRADFLDRLARHRHFLDELSRGLFFLSAPDADVLRETVVRPAALAGYTFENAKIVDDMMQAATTRGALPLLQFAATRLWDARDQKRRLLTVAAYQQMGGVGGAFARHADEVVAAVPPQSQPLLRAMLTRLVTPESTRAVVDLDELHGLTTDRADAERILDQLARGRLISVHTEGTTPTVELVHEVLITEWPTLARWLEDSQALRGFMAELRTAVKQWLARGKPADLVWRGATAQEALGLAQRHVLDVSEAEAEFLGAMRRELARGRRRRVGVVAAIILVLAVVSIGGVLFTIKLSRANAEAERTAIEARDAEAKVQGQLDAVRAAEAKRVAAETEKTTAQAAASRANAQVAQSQEELQKANSDLTRALGDAQREKATAQELAKKAAAATEDAKAASAKLQALLATEQKRVQQLELEKKKIATGGLK